MTIVMLACCGLGGYVASIYTWPWLRQALTGAEAEVQALRAKARALEAQLRG